jgi:hypothetical protein
MDMDSQPAAGTPRPGLIAGGAMVLVVGLTLWLDSTGLFDVSLRKLIGPLILITLGTVMLFGKGGFVYGYRPLPPDGHRPARVHRWRGTPGGVWLIGIGAWMLIAQTHAFGLDFHNSWPLFIILSGIVMLIRGVR